VAEGMTVLLLLYISLVTLGLVLLALEPEDLHEWCVRVTRERG